MPIEETDRPVWRSALYSVLLGKARCDGCGGPRQV